MSKIGFVVGSVLIVAWVGTGQAATAEQKCQGGKNEAAGKLAACLAKAEKKLVTGGDPANYAAAVRPWMLDENPQI